MTRERLYLYDPTLRDGQQTQGVQFSVAEKQQIATALDDLGVHPDADTFAVIFVALLRGIAAQFAVSPDAVDMAAARSTCAEIVRAHLEPTDRGAGPESVSAETTGKETN